MTTIKYLRDRLVLLLVAVAAAALFHYFGGLTVPASILVGGCFTIAALWIYVTFMVATFKPYGVEVFVNFEALREDLGMEKRADLSEGDKPAHELYNFTAISSALYVHYREYVCRTAEELNLSGRSTRTDDMYCSEIAFGDTIPGILKFSNQSGAPSSYPVWLPRFVFRPNWKGFELELHVDPTWWSEYKKRLSPEMRDRPVHFDGSGGFMVLAHLPYGYIPDHVRRWDMPRSLFYPFRIINRRWKTKLGKHGWCVKEPDEEISSRYLIVRYRPIWSAH